MVKERTRPARVLIAPDKFKGSLAAQGVAEAVSIGIRRVVPDADVATLPVADGGDGTVDAAVAAGFERVAVTVAGPTGTPVETSYARRGSIAVVEMADACGLGRLPGGVPAPLTATSRGLGEVVAGALAAGCRELVVGIGGSASTDGGAGLVAGLGAVLLGASGRPVSDGGDALIELRSLDLTGLQPALGDASLVVACDVDNPLTGPDGAAHVYGPQKGAGPVDIEVLERGLTHWADVIAALLGADHRNVPGAGAAGGVGFAAVSLLGADLRPGIGLMLDLLGFASLVEGCDLVVTGEGSLDEQSLHGKAPIGVAARARAAGVPVVAVCGRRLLDEASLRSAGIDATYALTDLEPDVGACIRDPAPLLELLGADIARRHLL